VKILLTGSHGYVGSVLLPKLYRHETTTLDIGWFGGTPDIRRDIRDFSDSWYGDLPCDAIIHLAGVANDPCGELDPKLAWEINVLGTMRLADWAVRSGVKQFIYASSGSVYGVCDEEVTEDSPLLPLSDYNRTKMCAERVLLSYADKIAVQIVRPATVCGWSSRMRLDVMVNSFVIQALEDKIIQFNGGGQWRPNIHIQDMTDLYVWLLDHPEVNGIYNAGFENLRISDIAEIISDRIGCGVIARTSNDPRSYRINSDRLLNAGFKPKKKIIDAIDELTIKYRQGMFKDEDRCYNIKTMLKRAA